MGQHQFAEFIGSLSAGPPDYARVRAPALAIYAGAQTAFRLEVSPPESRPQLERFLATTVEPWRAASIEQFRRAIPRGEVVTMNAAHHLFLHKPEETAAIIRRFLRRHSIH
jgi:pimeloyl-ACP methyl ester carboxylesterase